MTPGWRAAITASTCAARGTIASLVISPARPRSSSNAARTIGSMISRIAIAGALARLSAERQHAFDRLTRAISDRRVDRDLVGHRFKRMPDLG